MIDQTPEQSQPVYLDEDGPLVPKDKKKDLLKKADERLKRKEAEFKKGPE